MKSTKAPSLIQSIPVSASSSLCLCNVCSILDVEESIKQGILASFPNDEGRRPYLKSLNFPFIQNDTNDSGCPLRMFLSQFVKKEINISETNRPYTIQLRSRPEEKVA